MAVIDSGIDYTHEDLAANMWQNPGEVPGNSIDDDGNGYIDDVPGIDTFNGDSDPIDDNDHGTHVAGIVGAVGDNNIGVVGVNWQVQMMALKFLDSGGVGSVEDAIEALDYVIDMKVNHGINVKITNNSWGGGAFSQALYDTVAAARDADILFIAAAGNANQDNDESPHYPSSFDLSNVIAVSASDHNDAKASFSQWGSVSVDVAAPGADILSTTRSNTYSTFSGTSMATPHESGLAAVGLLR